MQALALEKKEFTNLVAVGRKSGKYLIFVCNLMFNGDIPNSEAIERLKAGITSTKI